MSRIPKPSPAMVVALAGVVIGLGGVAFATIPDSSGTIHGCYYKTNGNLRVVESASDCRPSETAIDWNQEGPPGEGGGRELGQIVVPGDSSQVLFAEGPLTFTGKCDLDASGTTDLALILISTTQDHAAFEGGFRNANLTTAAPESRRILFGADNELQQDNPLSNRYRSNPFTADAPDGTSLSGVLFASVGALGHTNECVFGGHLPRSV